MVHVVEMSKKEKIKMYMKLPKKELAEMLYNCNLFIDSQPLKYFILEGNDKLKEK